MQESLILVFKENGKWKLFSHKVRYIDNGTEYETCTTDVGWYETFSQIHNNFELVEIEKINYTTIQIERLSEVENANLAYSIINDYVMEGTIGEGLEVLELKKENEELKQLLADLTETVLLGGAI